MKKKELTPDQQRLILRINYGEELDKKDQLKIFRLPKEFLISNLLTYINKHEELTDEAMAKLISRYKYVGKDVVAYCIKNLNIDDKAQLQIFKMPAKLRDEMLKCLSATGNSWLCDEALLKILDLPRDIMMDILTNELRKSSILSPEIELKIMTLGQETADKFFKIYKGIPTPQTFAKVMKDWDEATKKNFFLTNVAKIDDSFTCDHDKVIEMMKYAFKLSSESRDEILTAYAKKGCMNEEIVEKVCKLPDPSRTNILMLNAYSTEALEFIFALPIPVRTTILLHRIKNSKSNDFSIVQIDSFFRMEEPYRSALLEAYAEMQPRIFSRHYSEKIFKLPMDLRTKLVMRLIAKDWAASLLFYLIRQPDPLRTEALSAYYAKAEHPYYFRDVFSLPDPARKAILLAAFKAHPEWVENYQDTLYQLPEPTRTELLTYIIENGAELTEPWRLWLLPKETREQLIQKYEDFQKQFSSADYEAKIAEIVGRLVY